MQKIWLVAKCKEHRLPPALLFLYSTLGIIKKTYIIKMKISKTSIIFLFLFQFSFSQKNILADNLFCRETVSFGKHTFLFASEGKSGYLLKLENNIVKDTLSTFYADKTLSGFHKLYVNKNNIYLVFDSVKELTVNDTTKIKTKNPINHIISLNHNGKLLWHNSFQPASDSAKDFVIAESTKRENLFIGFNSWGRVIVDKDTIGKPIFKNRATVLKINKEGEFIDIIDFSKIFKSSRIYQLKKRKNKPVAITLNYPENISTTNKKLQLISNQRRAKKNYLNTDSLQLIDVFYSKPFDYLFTWEGYFLKMKRKKIKKSIKFDNKPPNGTEKQTDINHKKIFDNGLYFSYVSLFEFRDSGKSWDTPNSLIKVYVEIKHVDKITLKVIASDSQTIQETKNWVSIESCDKNQIGIIVDGKYRLLKK